MEIFELLLPLALVIAFSKVLAIFCRKIGLPEVVGMLVAGILLGLIILIPGQKIFVGGENGSLAGLSFIAEIGVILIMFTAGLETDLKLFKKVGIPSVVITTLGVITPLGLGFVVACAFNPVGGFADLGNHEVLLSNIFYGCILCATSVSLTVAVLKEMGKLQTKVGASVLAAAILDDIIAIVIISIVLSIKENGAVSAGEIAKSIGMIFAFFISAFVIGCIALYILLRISKKPMHRIPIFAVAICFFYSYAAQKWFGVADITGAYVAGLVLSMAKYAPYIDEKLEISSYLIFEPVFFANIGISMISRLSSTSTTFDNTWVVFGIVFVLVALASKVVGCGAGALMFRYGIRDSYRVGIGMMARAEVVLVCANMGIQDGLVSVNIMPFVIILIIVSSMLVPALLKFSYRHEVSAKLLPRIPDDFSLNTNNTDYMQ
ncbi:MAG: cation:proton antiporter [Clostridia bacterium]|nr:cation:proton antiporter [Clostridia bacterium]